MSNEPFDQPPAGFEPPLGYPAPPSPPPPPPPVARQLVRDPYTKLGGVASGLAHHYGIDVSVVRIAFVVFTIISGFGVPIYLLSWLIIPRAQYWPPVGARKPARALSGREIGIVVVLLIALITLLFNGGALSNVLVPLVLVAGGVWLLVQPSNEEGAAAGVTGFTQPVDSVDSVDPAATTVTRGTSTSLPPGSPVPPKRRRWKPVVAAVVLLIVAIPVAAVSALVFTDVEFNADFSATYQPTDVESIPELITHDNGEVVVDLTELDASMFSGEPLPMVIDLGFGEVRVIVPEGLDVAVAASTAVGDIQVFDDSRDGIRPELNVPEPDAQIALTIEVGFGAIKVERG